MNIAGAQTVRFDEEHGDQANDRSVGLIRPANGLAVRDLYAEIRVADLLRGHAGCLAGFAVVFEQGLSDFFRTRADQFDFALQQETQTVDRIYVERIADRNDQSGFTEPDRDDFESPSILRSNLSDHLRRNNLRRKIHPLRTCLLGKMARHVGFRNVIFFRLHWGVLVSGTRLLIALKRVNGAGNRRSYPSGMELEPILTLNQNRVPPA